jgi:hypothetical protein
LIKCYVALRTGTNSPCRVIPGAKRWIYSSHKVSKGSAVVWQPSGFITSQSKDKLWEEALAKQSSSYIFWTAVSASSSDLVRKKYSFACMTRLWQRWKCDDFIGTRTNLLYVLGDSSQQRQYCREISWRSRPVAANACVHVVSARGYYHNLPPQTYSPPSSLPAHKSTICTISAALDLLRLFMLCLPIRNKRIQHSIDRNLCPVRLFFSHILCG